MKGIILDSYGTLVKIARNTFPYRGIDNFERMSKDFFYGRIFSYDRPHEEMLRTFRIPEELIQASVKKMEMEIKRVQPFPEALAFLQSLDDRGIPWRIVSNISTPYCGPLMNALGISGEKCFFSCRDGFLKPGSDGLNLAAESMGLAPEDIIVIGTSKRLDAEAARWARMQSFLLKRPLVDLWDALDTFDGKPMRNRPNPSGDDLSL
jgi:FMN phosphatase YigB (HAD superfamily)